MAYGAQRQTCISLDGTRVDARGAVTGGSSGDWAGQQGRQPVDRGRLEQVRAQEAELRGRLEQQQEAVAAAKKAEEAALEQARRAATHSDMQTHANARSPSAFAPCRRF